MDLKNGTKKRTEKSTTESAKNPPKTANNCPKPAPNRLRIAIEVKKGAQNS
jgi:uncharacterized membrane protein (UPF0127 family)